MISIIIPTYNEEIYLPILLRSLSEQEGAGNFEVIVSDAYSKDKTREIAFSFSHFFSKLLVVDGGMPAAGRNRGAEASTGDLLFFVDADLIFPDRQFFTKAETFFRKNNLGISTTYLKPLSNNLLDKTMMVFYSVCLYFSKYFRALGAMCIIADREVFFKAGGYPEDVVMNEDHDLMLHASRIGRYAVTPLSASFSVRRFEKEGRGMLIWKYTQGTYHNLVHGPIKKPIFTYEFGEYAKKEDTPTDTK